MQAQLSSSDNQTSVSVSASNHRATTCLLHVSSLSHASAVALAALRRSWPPKLQRKMAHLSRNVLEMHVPVTIIREASKKSCNKCNHKHPTSSLTLHSKAAAQRCSSGAQFAERSNKMTRSPHNQLERQVTVTIFRQASTEQQRHGNHTCHT